MKPALAIRKAMKEQTQAKKQCTQKQHKAEPDKMPPEKSNKYEKVVKSTTVNHRPYFKWKNTEILGN